MSNRKKGLALTGNVVAMIFWSFSFLWYKEAYLNHLPPFTIVFARLAFSSILLFATAALIKKLQLIKTSHFKYLLLLAFFEPFLYFIGESLGMKYVTPTTGAIIISLVPLLVPFLGFFILSEKLLTRNIVGIIISFIGVLFVVITPGFQLAASMEGLLLMGLAVISAACYSIVLKKLSAYYNPFTLISWQNTIGAFMFLPLTLYFDVKTWNIGMVSPDNIIVIAKLSIFASSIAFLLYTYSVKITGAVKSSILINLIPVFTALLSFFFLEEKLTLYNIFGIVLVLAGLILSQLESIKSVRLRNK
jgi:drug/metabolite transporter (DMT)-like permease